MSFSGGMALDLWGNFSIILPVISFGIRNFGLLWQFPRGNTATPEPVHDALTTTKRPCNGRTAPNAARPCQPTSFVPNVGTIWDEKS